MGTVTNQNPFPETVQLQGTGPEVLEARGIRSLGDGITGVCEPPDIDCWNSGPPLKS